MWITFCTARASVLIHNDVISLSLKALWYFYFCTPRGAGKEMDEWFLLDRINIDRAWISVDHSPQNSVDINPDPTFATLAGGNHAVLGT
jgi:hypothetical protein